MARKKEPAYETEKYTFPSRLYGLMKDRGTRQKELAEAIGMRPQTVSLYVQGQSFPDVNGLEKIARFFSVSADYLLGLSDDLTTNPDIKVACATTGLSESAIQALAGSEQIQEYNFLLTSNSFKEFVNLISLYNHHLIAMAVDDMRHESKEKEAAAKGHGYIDLRMEWKRNDAERRGIKAELIETVFGILKEIDSHYKGWGDKNGQH